jgi:hypothetical protein
MVRVCTGTPCPQIHALNPKSRCSGDGTRYHGSWVDENPKTLNADMPMGRGTTAAGSMKTLKP